MFWPNRFDLSNQTAFVLSQVRILDAYFLYKNSWQQWAYNSILIIPTIPCYYSHQLPFMSSFAQSRVYSHSLISFTQSRFYSNSIHSTMGAKRSVAKNLTNFEMRKNDPTLHLNCSRFKYYRAIILFFVGRYMYWDLLTKFRHCRWKTGFKNSKNRKISDLNWSRSD